MNVAETQKLLKIARKSELYPKIMRDIVIIQALENRLPLNDVQATLTEMSLPIVDKED